MLKVISIFLAIVYLAVNTSSLVASAVESDSRIQHIAAQGDIICDSGLSSDFAERNCEHEQQKVPVEDSEHCFGTHFNFSTLVFIHNSPTCDLTRPLRSDVRVSFQQPDLIAKPPRIFS